MAKLKYDVSGIEYGEAGDLEQPKPGVYKATIKEINPGFSKDKDSGNPDRSRPRLEVVLGDLHPLNDPDDTTKYAQLWRYLSYSEAAEIYMAQFMEAIGVATSKKRKGTWDPDEHVGKTVKIRVVADTNQDGDYRGKVNGIFAYDGEDGDDDEYEEPEDDGDEDDEDEEEPEYTDMTLQELRAEAVERGLLKKKEASSKKTKTLIALLEEDDEAEDDDEDEEDEEEDDNGADEDEEDDDTEEDEDEEDEDDEDEEDDEPYEEWSIQELRDACEERDLKTTGSKKALIKRLEDDDEEGDDEDDEDDDDESPF